MSQILNSKFTYLTSNLLNSKFLVNLFTCGYPVASVSGLTSCDNELVAHECVHF